MKGLRSLLITILLLGAGVVHSQTANSTYLLVLKSGASFKVSVLELTDSVLTYNTGNHIGKVPVSSIKKMTLVGNAIYYRQNTRSTAVAPRPYKRRRFKDTTPVFSNKPFLFVNFGIKTGLIEEDIFVRPTTSFLLDVGGYWPIRKDMYLGPSVGLHPYAVYDAVILPARLEYKYLLTPRKNRSLGIDASLGYGLQLVENNPFGKGGLNYSISISRVRSKRPNRVNEINFGFVMDKFKATDQIITDFRLPPVPVTRHVTARRFFVSKRWWFK